MKKIGAHWYILCGWWNGASGFCAVVTRNPRFNNRWIIFGPFTEGRARRSANRIRRAWLDQVAHWQRLVLMWEFSQPSWMLPRCTCNKGERNPMCPVYHAQAGRTAFVVEERLCCPVCKEWPCECIKV